MKTIPLTQGQFAIIDDADFGWLSKYGWCAFKSRYGGFVAVRNTPKIDGKRRTIYMHRQIVAAAVGMDVDHRNHNMLDNRKHNLRICTRRENLHNSRPRKDCASQFKGVAWHRGTEKWRAYISSNGKQRHIGLFDIEEKAAIAYNHKAVEIFGEFAKLNVIK